MEAGVITGAVIVVALILWTDAGAGVFIVLGLLGVLTPFYMLHTMSMDSPHDTSDTEMFILGLCMGPLLGMFLVGVLGLIG